MNTTKRHIRLFVVLIILGLISVGCSAPSETPPVQTHIAPQSTTTMPRTATPQNTPTQMSPFHADLSCWQMKPLQAGNDIKGSLLLGYGNSGFFYWDVSSFHAKFFADTIPSWGSYLNSTSLPPDRNSIPVVDSDQKILLTSLDNTSVTFNLPPGNLGLRHLLNGKILVVQYGSVHSPAVDNEIYQKDFGYTDTYYIYDAKTGVQMESRSVFLPKFNFYHAGGMDWAEISYSPDGNFVLYRSTLLDGNDGYSLLDLRSNQVKWTVPVSNKESGEGDSLASNMPVWKSDASSLTYIWASDSENKEPNFYNISLDGVITQFTRFEEVFQSGYILNSNPQWSPDNRYMTFRVQMPDHPSEPEFFIWDDLSKTLSNPCLPVTGIASPAYGGDWSFDSKHIVLGLPFPDMPSPRLQHLMLDIPNRILYELPSDKDMLGYLKLSGKESPYSDGFWMNWEVP